LLMTTPTSEFMDRVIAKDGTIDDAAVARLLRGQAPISDDGLVQVDGEINAAGAIEISGMDVAVTGSLRSASPAARARLFAAAVNTNGIAEGVELSQEHGTIVITAAEDADIDGT